MLLSNKNFVSFQSADRFEMINLQYCRAVTSSGDLSIEFHLDNKVITSNFNTKQYRDEIMHVLADRLVGAAVPADEKTLLINNHAMQIEQYQTV